MARAISRSAYAPRALMRGVAVVSIATLALVPVLSSSVAGAFRDLRPAWAALWSPFDSGARGNLAVGLVATSKLEGARTRARALALDAIRRDGLSVAAFRAFGLEADARRDRERALRYFEYAQTLSRRDQATQVWLIDNSGRRGDLLRAVRHLNIALTTSYRNWDALLPLMVALTGDSRALGPISQLLDKQPVWRRAFLARLAASGPSPASAVALARGRLDVTVSDERGSIQRLLNRLVADRQFALAWRFYLESNGNEASLTRMSVRNPSFELAAGLSPFDWEFTQEADLSADTEPRSDGRGNALSLLATNGRAGVLARQLLRLEPGRHRLRAEGANISSTVGERPVLLIACAGPPDRTIFQARPPAGAAPRRFGNDFLVPPNCDWQWITIQLSGTDPRSDTLPWVDNIEIRKAR